MRRFHSHGDGRFTRDQLAAIGEHVIFEDGVRVWHPETIEIGDNVYIGHDAMLKGYHLGRMVIGDDTWIGQGAFLHSAGSLRIGQRVGVGPMVKVLTSSHRDEGRDHPVLGSPLEFAQVVIGDDVDLGIGSIVLPGVTIGRGVLVGAGAVVVRDVEPYAVVAGNPARVIRMR